MKIISTKIRKAHWLNWVTFMQNNNIILVKGYVMLEKDMDWLKRNYTLGKRLLKKSNVR